jgi:hypothetical protein
MNLSAWIMLVFSILFLGGGLTYGIIKSAEKK